jgi:hypothetical protein
MNLNENHYNNNNSNNNINNNNLSPIAVTVDGTVSDVTPVCSKIEPPGPI